MSVAITNNKIFELAKEIAEQAGMQCDDEHIQTARKRLQIAAFDDRLQKRVAAPTGEDEELLQKAIEAQFQRRDPHAVGLGGPPHQRIEIGEVETREHGRLRIAHDRTDGGTLVVHDVAVRMEELDRDLRDAIVDTSAAFSLAATAESQATQRAILGTIMSEVMARPSHSWFADKVKERTEGLRFTAV